MLKSKKLLIFLLVAFLLISSVTFAFARKTEITYPRLPDNSIITPTDTSTLLPDYVNYIFAFVIVISAIVAFGSLFYGGVRWLTSAGSSGAINEAKDRMKAGGIGLIIILFSWAILNTINPQIVTVNPGTAVDWGIALYTNDTCTEPKDGKIITRNSSGTEPLGGSFLKFDQDVPWRSLEVKVNGSKIIKNDPLEPSYNNNCQNIGFTPTAIEFIWKLPGVYLIKNDAEKTEKFLPDSTATLDDFNDSLSQIKLLDIKDVGLNFGAVLHEHVNWKGGCKVFNGEKNFATWYDLPDWGPKTSSVTTFIRADERGPGGVTFFENDNFGGNNFEAEVTVESEAFTTPDKGCKNVPGDPPRNDWATSMRISGNYIAVLFDDNNCTGKCQIFTSSDSNFRDDEIGRCDCGPFGWGGCHDCLSSYIVMPTK